MARTASTDPLEKFRFLVTFQIPNGSDAGVSQTRTAFHDIQMPKRTTNKIMYREGTDLDISSVSAGLSSMEDIVMSRGVIADDGTKANDLYKWMSTVHKPSTGLKGAGNGSVGIKAAGATATGGDGKLDYRSDVTITMLDRSGTSVRAWKLYNAFPVNFTPGSDLNAAEDGEKSLESLTLAYEDFEELSVTSGAVTTNAHTL